MDYYHGWKWQVYLITLCNYDDITSRGIMVFIVNKGKDDNMSISNTVGVGNKVDLTYHLKSLAPGKTPLKLDVYQDPPIGDIISISHEAKVLLEEELDAMFEQLKGSTDDSNNPLKIQLQCLKIAMRIISGDNVPSKDRAFLAEHEPGMLGRAILLRRTKENPIDYKSILEDEKVDEPTESVSSDHAELSVDVEI